MESRPDRPHRASGDSSVVTRGLYLSMAGREQMVLHDNNWTNNCCCEYESR